MNVLWIPIFSMRSYKTGQYSILKDGNFQLTMSRVLASDFGSVTVVVPKDSSDYIDMKFKLRNLQAGRIQFLEMDYGMNAVKTRENFWDLNREQLTSILGTYQQFDLVISDITGYDIKTFHPVPIVYNFNITKLPELDRSYIDKFFEEDLKSIEESLFTTVINPRQREYILEVRPDLLNKVHVNTKCAHELLLPKSVIQFAPQKTFFWPFRLSDKSYQWEQFLEAFVEQGFVDSGHKIVITDPNESSTELPAFVQRISPSKEEYYKILSARPIVVMLDDIDTVLHPGTIEFFYFGCPVITYESNLIQHPNMILDLKDLWHAVMTLEYNQPKGIMDRFVYQSDEVDRFYNEVFVNVRKN